MNPRPEILRAVREINPAERIDLSNTEMDNSLLHFLRDLRVDEIDLTDNAVTLECIEDLRQHLEPTCNIIHD